MEILIFGDIGVMKNTTGEIEGLPDQAIDAVYIVSYPVLQALREKGIKREDIVAPEL